MENAAPANPPKDYLFAAILSIFCGFWPFGIVATIYANKTSSLKATGQMGPAAVTSRKALRWMIASFVTLPALLVVLIGWGLINRALM